MISHFRKPMFRYWPVKTAFFIAFALLASMAAEPAQAQQPLRLTPADAATISDVDFGEAVALSGNLALVGSTPYNSPGSAYLFDVTTGQQLWKLTATDGVVNDNFGKSIALSGNRALVGAPYSFDPYGAAYIFDTATGQQLQKLLPTDGVQITNVFGTSVALDGATALVGAPRTGWAYLYDVPTGQLLRKLKVPSGVHEFDFGESVALSGNTALVTALKDVFVFDITTGAMLRKISLPFYLGQSVDGADIALSGDIAVLGTSTDDHAGSRSGSAYVYNVATGQQLFKLTASEPAAQDYFGETVALNGNLALISSMFDDGTHDTAGSAYLFDVTTGKQLARFTSPDDASGSKFARSVALNGNTALFGGAFTDDQGSFRRVAYLFDVTVPEPTTLLLAAMAIAPLAWRRRVQIHVRQRSADFGFAALSIAVSVVLVAAPAKAQVTSRLTPADAATPNDVFFGVTVALSGNLALVGNDQSNWSDPPPGSAYVFDVTTGQQLRKLTPTNSVEGNFFGSSVALNGNLALVGAPGASGAAYLFDATTGQQLHEFGPSDFRPFPSPIFGNSVALSGTTALIAAVGEEAAYLFDVTTGQQLHKIVAPSPGFGAAVALSGNKALITARNFFQGSVAYVYDITSGEQLISIPIPYSDPNHSTVGFWGNIALISAFRDDHAGVNSGAAFLYDVTTGQQLFKLTASDPAENDYFGEYVALSGNLALVASPFDDGAGIYSGAAYLFDVTTGRQLARFTSADDGISSRFARSVALNGNMALIGGSFSDKTGFIHGAAYLVDVSVPEPSTTLLAALSLTPLTWRRRAIGIQANKSTGYSAER